MPAVLCPILDSPVQKTDASPVKGSKDDEGARASLIRSNAERAGTVQHGEKKAQGAHGKEICAYKYLVGTLKTNEPDSSR